MLSTPSTIAAILAFTGDAVAYTSDRRSFAVNHFYGKGPLLEASVDPIVSPGSRSDHVHAIQGGNAFKMTMSDDDPLSSTCTSSLVKNDKSNYWTPKMYFQNDNGTFEPVELFYMNVYYFFEATTDKIRAFPPGLRMLVGNTSLRSPPANATNILDLSDGAPQPIQITCPRMATNDPLYPVDSDGLHGVGIQDPGNKGSGVGFPDRDCDGYASPMRLDIHFPSCYNPAVGLHDYNNNMEWPTHGNCPEGFIHVPHLFYEVYWNTPKFVNLWTPGQGKQPFVLANGDPTGYSLHGDFIAGWDEETLQQIIDNCDAGDSGMDKCPGLIGGLNDPSTSCNIPSPLMGPLAEVITGTLAALPGSNPVTDWGSSPAPAASSSAASQAPASTSAAAPRPTTPTPAPVESTDPSNPDPISSQTNIISNPPPPSTSIQTSTSNSTPTPTGTSNSINGYTYHGCFTDHFSPSRALTAIPFANIGQHAVTNTKCITYCAVHGYALAGTEYGGQCFCDNALTGSEQVDDDLCDMPCEGDGVEICGGRLLLSVYKKLKGPMGKREGRQMHMHRRSRV
ncbi:putative WSC domain protein [Calycina marina]|uniref:WSC domain protein n=1 Tax=Calycina marina TaxID=1763456 RepID=A0A9P7Z6F4_9HELO|nr:putative WSC domain protein [Calycina marina]